MRSVMHHLLFNLDSDIKYNNESSIIGWLNYLKSVDEASYKQMCNYFNRLRQKLGTT